MRPISAGHPEGASGFAGQPRHRDFGSRRGRGRGSRHEIRSRLGAEPRADAPDRDRHRGDRADGGGRRLSRHCDRLRGRGLEFRWARLSVHRQEAARQKGGAGDRGRARRLSVADARQIRVRLRRHRPSDAARQDAYAGIGVHPARLPRGRPSLSRDGAAGQPLQGTGADRGSRLSPDARASRRASSSRGRKASCRPRKRPMRSARRSTKR